jgi:uncharacterized protein YbbC (DUF1343 family)
MKNICSILIVVSLFTTSSIFGQPKKSVTTGAENTGDYISLIKDKTIAIVANQTSLVGKTHLVDTLVSLGIKVKNIFAPEHGFRHLADAGEAISNGLDPKTGIQIISLYGKQYKPTPDNLEGVDVVIYDIQDVGTRFYTYISTLHYVLESCAESKV